VSKHLDLWKFQVVGSWPIKFRS